MQIGRNLFQGQKCTDLNEFSSESTDLRHGKMDVRFEGPVNETAKQQYSLKVRLDRE